MSVLQKYVTFITQFYKVSWICGISSMAWTQRHRLFAAKENIWPSIVLEDGP